MDAISELRQYLDKQATMRGVEHEELHTAVLEDGTPVSIRRSTLEHLLAVAGAVKPWVRQTYIGIYLNSPYLLPAEAESLKGLFPNLPKED